MTQWGKDHEIVAIQEFQDMFNLKVKDWIIY